MERKGGDKKGGGTTKKRGNKPPFLKNLDFLNCKK
jgi:hypothetical protein